jgi:molybdopterin synthase catalytic subunit
MYSLIREPIDTQQIADSLQKPEDGAVVIFEGVVRNHANDKAVRFLEYEAYESMALKKIEEIGAAS